VPFTVTDIHGNTVLLKTLVLRVATILKFTGMRANILLD
jgi:hypothetical protein